MPLEDYLLSGEKVYVQTPPYVGYRGEYYEAVITNKRLILYARRGFVFKSDDVISVKLDEIADLRYREDGIILKTAIIEIWGKRRIRLEGPVSTMKALYRLLQLFIK